MYCSGAHYIHKHLYVCVHTVCTCTHMHVYTVSMYTHVHAYTQCACAHYLERKENSFSKIMLVSLEQVFRYKLWNFGNIYLN